MVMYRELIYYVLQDLEALEQLQLQLEQDPCEVYKTICREKVMITQDVTPS